MRLHFLVEGASEVRLLEGLLPRLIPNHTFKIYPHQGKGKLPGNVLRRPDPHRRGLLDLLPATLRAWGKSLSPDTDRVVVLLDLDNDNCITLLDSLTQLVAKVDPSPHCLFRIAIEEVESWYLGDWTALKKAFPNASKNLWKLYQQDSICGTWETFQRVIQDSVERKPVWAEKMGHELSVDCKQNVNKSVSFYKFCTGVRRLAGDGAASTNARSHDPARPRRQ